MTPTHRARRSAALAVVAVVVALLGGPAGSAHAAFPDESRIDPTSLARGGPAAVLHSVGRTVVDGDRRIRAERPRRLQLIGKAPNGTGYVVVSFGTDGRNSLWRVTRDGSAVRLRGLGQDGRDAQLSPSGARVSWTRQGRDRTTVFVARTYNGRVVARQRYKGILEVLDVRKRVLLSGIRPVRTIWYRPSADSERVVRGLQLVDADLARDRAVVVVRDLVNGYDGVCLAYAVLSDPARRLWRSCTDKPVAFSPSGRLMVTTNIEADGAGTGLLQIRTAETNLVRATLRTRGYFSNALWESEKSLLAVTWQSKCAAIVRITKDGSVHRASALVRAAFGTEGSRWGFPPS